MDTIQIRGARTHNLKQIDLNIPRNQLVVITGLSGSGKSSLAFDTLYAEGQRRYVESLSAYARQFLSVMEKPDVDHIEGLSPAISIEQKATSHNPRSTVGTITEIYDYLRLLYARIGEPFCPTHQLTLSAQSTSQIVEQLMDLKAGTKLMLLAPIIQDKKGEHFDIFQMLKAKGYLRAVIDGELVEINQIKELKKTKKHSIEVVIDRLSITPENRQRLAESIEHANKLAEGLIHVHSLDSNQKWIFSTLYACPQCGFSTPPLEPKLFSFNNPMGACSECKGLGTNQYFDPKRLIANPALSLAEGAIRGWDAQRFYYFSMLQSVAKHYGFSCNTPFQKLTETVRKIILYGSGDETITFHFTNHQGNIYKKTQPFEGVIPNMQRRYHETESHIVREELAKFLSTRKCSECEGTRLSINPRHVYINKTSLPQLTEKSIQETLKFFKNLKLQGKKKQIAEKINKEIIERLSFLENVGLDYLTLARSSDTLSGGEAQRIRLASQIGSGLVGVMYILDEPSIGLHQKDNDRLLSTLFRLKQLGNTVIVVEHDEEAILSADHIIDMGPGAGLHGGMVVAEGTPEDILKNPRSITGQYLSGTQEIPLPIERIEYDKKNVLCMKNVTHNNLKNLTVKFPLGLMTCVTGVSGSGKSSLVNDTLYLLVRKAIYGDEEVNEILNKAELSDLKTITDVIHITQSPIGRTPRSNPATYTGLFTPIRELFASTQEARARGYQPGRFSFNVAGGRCESCQGDGLIKVEMHFLPDLYVHCDECKGKRYNRETLDIHYKGKNIQQVLDMTVEEAHQFFQAIPVISNKLQTLMDVGLSYIHLGQSATTLSGGEAQRVKLSKELSKRSSGNTLYILDEPTTGLHFHDIRQLLQVLLRLRDKGNTIIVIEHNLDVIKCADWIIDLGPEGGGKGGKIVAEGTPEDLIKHSSSYTAEFLKKHLERHHLKMKNILKNKVSSQDTKILSGSAN